MFRDVTCVRERLWLIAHDEDRDLRPRIDVRALGIGLTGAAVADLLLQNRIHIQQGRVFLYGRDPGPSGDPVSTAVLDALRDQQAPRLSDLLRDPFLRLYERTVAALVASGVVVEQRRMLRGNRYCLAHDNTNMWIRSQFTRRLYKPASGDLALDTVCALVWALNLHSTLLLPYNTAEADDILRTVTAQIPSRVGPRSHHAVIPHLAECVRHAVGDLATAPF